MRVSKPRGLISGFMIEAPDANVPELTHAGQQHAPSAFFVAEHAHAVWEFYLQAHGRSQWEVMREGVVASSFTLNAGDFFAAPPSVRHRMAPSSHGKKATRSRTAKHSFLFAALDLEAVLARLPECREVWAAQTVHLGGGSALGGAFRALLREVAREGLGRSAGVRLALDTLVLEASRLQSESAVSNLSGASDMALRAREAMENAPERAWRSRDLAKLCGATGPHLIEEFGREVGMTPRQYLLNLRMERARDLLRTELSVAHIARELGFSSSQHFTNTFRQRVGTSPTKWRSAPR